MIVDTNFESYEHLTRGKNSWVLFIPLPFGMPTFHDNAGLYGSRPKLDRETGAGHPQVCLCTCCQMHDD
jgi:hypothetical protein